MAVMFLLSTDTFAAEETGPVLWDVLSGLLPHVTYEQYMRCSTSSSAKPRI